MSDLMNADATTETQDMAGIAAGIQSNVSQEAGSESTGGQEATDNVTDMQEFIKQTAQQSNDLKAQVDTLTKQQQEFVNSQRLEQVNKEIKSAVEAINGKVGGDPEMAELYLEKQYATNPDLKKVWDNRAENPEALNKALELLNKEWAAKNQNMIDPQVAENQRALMDSQRSGGTVQNEDLDIKLANMSDAEFMREMRRLGG